MAAASLTALTLLRTVVAAPPGTTAPPATADEADEVIVGQLALPGGPSAAFQVRDGSLLFAQRDRESSAIAFAPRVRPQGIAWLPLLVDERSVRQPGREAPRTTAIGASRSVDSGSGRFTLLATRVGPADAPLGQPRYTSLRPQRLLDVHGRSGDGTCCVSSHGWTVCGAVVEIDQMSCRATPIVVARLDR